MRLAALAVASLAFAGPVLAQPSVSEPITGGLSGRGSAFASVGYLHTDGRYDDPAGTASDLETLTFRVGGEYVAVRSRSGAAGAVGLAIQAADLTLGGAFESGFQPQSAELYVRGAAPVGPAVVGATAGFVLDIGPTFGPSGDDDEIDFPTGDMQDALRFGAGASLPAGPVRVEAGAEYVATFGSSYQIAVTTEQNPDAIGYRTYEFDYGDIVTGYLGAALPVTPGVEVGLRAVLASTTESSERIDGRELEFRLPADRSVLSLVPHVRVAPEGSAFSAVLSAEALAGYLYEHVRYGVTVAGNNEYKARVPVTLAVRYGF